MLCTPLPAVSTAEKYGTFKEIYWALRGMPNDQQSATIERFVETYELDARDYRDMDSPTVIRRDRQMIEYPERIHASGIRRPGHGHNGLAVGDLAHIS